MPKGKKLTKKEIAEFLRTQKPHKDQTQSDRLCCDVYVSDEGPVLTVLENGKGFLYPSMTIMLEIIGETTCTGRPLAIRNPVGNSPEDFLLFVEQARKVLSSAIETDSALLDFSMNSLSMFDNYLKSIEYDKAEHADLSSALTAYTSEVIRRFVNGTFDCVLFDGNMLQPWVVQPSGVRLAVFLWVEETLREPTEHARFSESMKIYFEIDCKHDRYREGRPLTIAFSVIEKPS